MTDSENISDLKAREGCIIILDALGAKLFESEECIKFLKNIDEIVAAVHRNFAHAEDNEFSEVQKFLAKAKFELIHFGDTTLISIENAGWDDAGIACFASWVSGVFFINALERGIPLRGAISFGSFHKSGSSALGAAVSDAASWYEQPEFLGICYTPKAAFRVDRILAAPEKAEISPHLFQHEQLKLDAQYKSGRLQTYLVNWPLYLQRGIVPQEDPYRWFLDRIIRLKMPFGTDSKYRNTVALIEEMEKANRISGAANIPVYPSQ